ncbi:MAG: hypothetical protein AB1752_08415 [Candidatus Zixiibacteriota bacterium]
MRKVLFVAVMVTALALPASPPANSATLSGRVGISTYLWEYSELDTTDTRHVQNTGTLSLRLARIADRDIEINTALRGRYDLRNAGDNVDDYHVHHLQLRWRNIAKRADLTAGRQRLYWPTGSAWIDGAALAVRPFNRLEVSSYMGMTAPEDGRFKTTDFDKGHAFGVRAQFTRAAGRQIALSFAQRNTERAYGDVELKTIASQLLGLDWRCRMNKSWNLYGHANYDVLRERLSRVHGSIRWQATPEISVNGQFRFRRPDIAYNSIFWVFGDSRYYEGRMRLDYRFNPDWTVSIGGVLVDLVDDQVQRFDVGLAHRYFSFMLHGKSGWSGSTIGLSGDALYPLNEKWSLRGGARYSSFELYEDQEEANSEAGLWGGFLWQVMEQTSVDLEAQYLTQDITTQPGISSGDESDFRLLARVSWWFFSRLGQ